MGILLRNWHLKLSAILLATVLYTGLVFSGQFSEADISVRLVGVNPPDSSIVMSGDLGLVEVQYRTARTVLTTVSDQAFAASVDLSEYDMERAPEPQVLPVTVDSLFDGIDVLDREPARPCALRSTASRFGRSRSRSTPATCRRAWRSASRS